MNLTELLAGFPRESLAHLPTPLERMAQLCPEARAVRLWVKRDDCTGLALGGNKTRKLEFTLGAARAAGADTLITCGAYQSNHARQTAAAAARAGFACHLVLADSVARPTELYRRSGNMMLDALFGATIHFVANDGPATDARVAELSGALEREGRTPFFVPLGASDEVGSLGYVDCARELLEQCAVAGIAPSCIVVGTGSAGTHAGLLVGLRLAGSQARVIGISVSEAAGIKCAKVRRIANALLKRLDARRSVVADSDIEVSDSHAGPAYGAVTREAQAALHLAATREGLVLDPVYTAKAMAGLLALARGGRLSGDVIFLHTGGAPAIYAYADEFAVPSPLEPA